MMTNCPVCGKLTCIHWPEHWVYRRGSTYYCGEQCLTDDLVRDTKLMNEVKKRRKREKKMLTKITPEMRKKAAEIAISGESPLEYLKKCGSKNPSASWQYIRQTLEKNDPETFAKLPDRLPKTAGDAMIAMKEAADNFFSQCEDMGLKLDTPQPIDGGEWEKIETPEVPKRAPLQYDGFTVCCIESKTFGRFYWDRDHNHLDWTTAEGEEVSFTPTGWKMFLEELPKVAEILGVEL